MLGAAGHDFAAVCKIGTTEGVRDGVPDTGA